MYHLGSTSNVKLSALISLLISSALLNFINPTECTSTSEVKSSFVLQPKPVYYIVKSDVISLQCRAVHVAKMALKCNGEFVQVSKYTLTQDMENDTETITMNFTKRDLGAADAISMNNGASSALSSSAKSADGGSNGGGGGGMGSSNGGGSGGNDYLECVCVAWSRSNNWYEFESDSSIIRQAYLKKFFPREPLPLEVELGNQAEFLCSPPEGQPTPQVYWTKNQKRLDEDDPRYHISNNGRTLLIHQVTMDDQGEYLCLAKNMASLRMSHKATLKVTVTGTWSPWSEWSECSSQCGRGIQQRHRDCHFTPLTPTQAAKAGHLQQQAVTSQTVNNGMGKNGNNVCKGEATQTADCTKMCPQDGGWSEWGTWHACGINCVKYRRRECNNPPPSHGGVPCLGTGLDRANCTGGECTRTGPGMYTADGTPVLTGGNNGGSMGVNNNGKNGPIVRHDPAHISLKEVLLYVGLITIVAVFLAVAMAIVYLLHRRNKFYTGVLSIDERHHHYPTLSYTTDLPMSKCSGKTNGSLTNMIDMPYHISHSHLLRHPGQHGSLSTTPLNPHAHYHNYHPHLMSAGGGASSCTGSHTSQQHLSTATTTTTINHHHNSLLSAASPTSGGGAGSATGSNVSPPSYMSSDINSTQGLQRSLTPTYQYIEEHNQSAANSPTGPIADMIGAPGIAMMPIMTSGPMDLTHTASSLYSAHDPHYAHISESEFGPHNRQLNNNLASSANPATHKSKRNSVHSRFSVDSGHFGDQASHNSSETNQGTGEDHGNANPNQTTGWRQHQPVYTCTSLLPPSIDPGSVAVGMVGYAGGRLSLPESGISLLIPEGAITQGTTEELFLASSSDISENPRLLNTRDSILSATVFAGPPSVKFLKPVILSFDQSASRTEIDWTTSLYTQAPNADWKMCGDSGPSSKESTIHFEGKSCYVISERLKFKYCLVGKATSSAVKQNQVVLFGGYLKSGSNYSVRVYMLNDNRDALARTMGDEMKMGGFLLNSPLKLPLKFDQGALSLTLNDLCPEWNNSAQSQIEIPLERLWNDTSGNFHLSFSFESSSTYEQSNMAVASIGALSAKLNITQGDQQHEIPFCIRPHEIPMCPLLCESATGGSGNNWMYSSSGRVFKLSPFARARLAAALSESWTKLAKAIGLQKSVIDYLKRHAHPVDSVLDMWECRTHSEPQGVDLIKILTTIHRTDLVPLIEAEILCSSPTPPNCPSPTQQQQHAGYAMAGGNLASSSDNNSCHLSSSC